MRSIVKKDVPFLSFAKYYVSVPRLCGLWGTLLGDNIEWSLYG